VRLAAQLQRILQSELDQKFDEQSKEADQEKRKKLVWEIDKKLQEDAARPIIFTTAQLLLAAEVKG